MSDVIAKTFTNIQYVPVQTKSFEDVEIVLKNDTGKPVPFERGKVIATLHFDSVVTSLEKMNNPYVRYYLDQQQGHGMPVFSGSLWKAGYGHQMGAGHQMGFGIGGLFRIVARAVMPMVKSGAKALGNIALKSGADFVGDVLAGKT